MRKKGVNGSIMTLREATKMNAGSDCNFLASFCESGVSSAQVKQILNDPKKLQEEMALVQRNLAALQKAEQSMRNPYKRQQVQGRGRSSVGLREVGLSGLIFVQVQGCG